MRPMRSVICRRCRFAGCFHRGCTQVLHTDRGRERQGTVKKAHADRADQ